MIHYIVFDDVTQKKLSDIIANENKFFPRADEGKVFLKKSIDDIFNQAGFNPSFSGTENLKKAVYIAYKDQKLMYDTKKIVKIMSRINHSSTGNIRGSMDYTLEYLFNYSDYSNNIKSVLSNYDGRKPTTKYFIILCVNYLKNLYVYNNYY